jgi:hypothetical protein
MEIFSQPPADQHRNCDYAKGDKTRDTFCHDGEAGGESTENGPA